MLPIFLLLHYALAVLLLAGWLTDRGVAAWLGVGTDFAPLRWLAMGLLAVQTTMVVTALATPITPWAHLSVLAVIVVGVLAQRRAFLAEVVRPLQKAAWTHRGLLVLWGLSLLIACAEASTGYVRFNDTGCYHAQAVKWLTTFGSVPGLANLHFRLGFSSAWFPFCAFFDQWVLREKSYLLISLIPHALALAVFLSGVARLWVGNSSPAAWLRLGAGFLVVLGRYNLPSLSYDYSSGLLTYLLLLWLVEWFVLPRATPRGMVPETGRDAFHGAVLLVLAAGAMAMKLSTAPLLPGVLLFLLLFVPACRRAGFLLRALVVCGCILVPLFAQNVVLSGYPLFPAGIGRCAFLDWCVPARDQAYVVYATQVGNHGLPVDGTPFVEMVARRGWLTHAAEVWLRPWRTSFNACLLVLVSLYALLLPFVPVVLLLSYGRGMRVRWLAVQAMLMACLVYWAIFSPIPRFIPGIIVFAACSAIVIVGGGLARGLAACRTGWLAGAAYVACLLWMVHGSGLGGILAARPDNLSSWGQLKPLLDAKVVDTPVGPGTRIFVTDHASGDMAWAHPLPTAPAPLGPIQQRSASLRDGYRR